MQKRQESAFLNEAEMKKNNKDMFERFRDKELPPEIQAHVESSANIHGEGNKNKWWFTAGFFVAQNIKEIRKKMGIDD